MKKLITLSLVLISSFIIAQPYGQHLYPHPNTQFATGLRTSINTSAFFMLGSTTPVASWPYNFSVEKLQPGSGFPGAFPINRKYKTFYQPNCSGSATQIITSGIKGIETRIPAMGPNPEAWYALTMTYDQNVAFITLDAAGVPITKATYKISIGGNVTTSLPVITESRQLNQYYLAGAIHDFIYVMKVNAVGNIMWSNIYKSTQVNLFETYDIIESPYKNEVLVVGHVPLNNGRASDGYILRLDGNTGLVNTFFSYGAVGAGCDEFHTINLSNSHVGGPGFILGGQADNSSGLPGKTWVLKIDQAGGVIWSRQLTSTSGCSIVTDIVERPTSVGGFEYYASILASQMMVLKMEDFGIPYSGGNNEFLYLNTPSTSWNISLENNSGFPDEGIHVYGADYSSAISNHYLVEAYFNGETGCNQLLTTMQGFNDGPQDIDMPPITLAGHLTPCTDLAIDTYAEDFGANNLCEANVVSGGSNARQAVTTGIAGYANLASKVSVSPNPVINQTTVSYNVAIDSDVKIDLYNYLGQLIKHVEDKSSQAKGSYSTTIDFSGANLETGVYILKLSIGAKTTEQKIIFTK